jgi:hypothetical protein
MAVATTVRRDTTNNQKYGLVNLYLINSGTAAPGGTLTVGGDLTLTIVHELPNNGWQCEVTGPLPRGHAHLILHNGEAVTG